ncbi:TRAP transporter small permease [Primorskyibacter flagellatus]|uniref:TRAP transporter small permease protein n=1 Tax=Primorskyibacter flagellatus TaxID=1387277 RepID=A0A1W2DDH7_9RHOB|nr:TRAP transporter small permease [Primorskyibacter flagellatus]SMC95540.1 TRAP-type C4-dicarboxylate transport system, small permease component [Primorskyibacter flagellatus]
MRVVLESYYRFLKLLLTILMTLLIIPVSMQILSRYTGIIPRFIWTEEIARFCFVWIIMIGAMIAVRDGTHFDVDVLPRSASKYVEFASRMFVHLAILCMALSFVYWGYDFGILGSRQRSEISGLPMLSIYIGWPIAGATWTVFTLEKIWDEVKNLKGEHHGAR